MSKRNNALLINIIKNSGPDFKFREELIQLHSRCLQLESSINLRKQIEHEYNNLKLEEVKERIDEIKFQKKFFIKRNNDIINDLQKRNIKNIEAASNTLDIFQNLQKQKKKYGEYISSLIPKIQTEFNVELHKDSNKLARQKIDELKIYQKMKCKNEYYDEMIKTNEKLVNEINYLKKKNDEYEIKSKQKENKFLESKKKLQNQMDNFKIEEEKNGFDINEYLGENKINNKNGINNFHNINNEINNINLENKQINSEKESFEDYRKQIINPNKIDFNEDTIHQNFDKPRPEYNFTDNKIDEKIKLLDQIDDNMNQKLNNNEINFDKKESENKFNLINSGKFNNNIANNDINNMNNDINFDVNLENKVKFNNNNVKEIDNKKEEEYDDEFENYPVEVV